MKYVLCLYFFSVDNTLISYFFTCFPYFRRRGNKEATTDANSGQKYADLCSRCLIKIISFYMINLQYLVGIVYCKLVVS